MALCLAFSPLAPDAALASPTPAASGRFTPFSPLSLRDLYTKRMRFAEGEPILSVGLMEGQTSVTLGAEGPVRMMLEEGGLPRTVYAPAGSRFTFRPLRARPARLRHWVVVETRPYLDVAGARAAAREWAARAPAAEVLEVGTLLALRGNVLDTRERRVVVGGFPERGAAERLSAQLFAAEGRRTTLHEELLEPPAGAIEVVDGEGRVMHRAEGAVYFGTVEGGLVDVAGVEHGRGYASHGREDRRFAGHVYVALGRDARLTVVNSIGAERLLEGLVPAELFATAPLEALKAQAVTARGEVFSKLGHRHFGEPYHLCSEQHCQVYAGAGVERPGPTRAVVETRGLLAFRPRARAGAPLTLVDSVYSSTCGGFSEANETVWDQGPSVSLRARLDGSPADPALAPFAGGLDEANLRRWLEAVPPVDCARATFARPGKLRWRRTIPARKLDEWVRPHGVGRLRDVQVLGRGKGGRVTGVRLVGSEGQAEVLRELPVRRLFGNLESGMFVIDAERDPAGELVSLTFVGGGWGHGVGMCQMGAIGRAERGEGFAAILAHYYDGAVLERIY